MSAIAEVAPPKTNEGQKSSGSSVVKRKTARTREATEPVRYFLAREGTTGEVPNLGREFSNESEALIESMRTGLTYYAVSEWKATADFSGKNPQILKQTVALRHS